MSKAWEKKKRRRSARNYNPARVFSTLFIRHERIVDLLQSRKWNLKFFSDKMHRLHCYSLAVAPAKATKTLFLLRVRSNLELIFRDERHFSAARVLHFHKRTRRTEFEISPRLVFNNKPPSFFYRLTSGYPGDQASILWILNSYPAFFFFPATIISTAQQCLHGALFGK